MHTVFVAKTQARAQEIMSRTTVQCAGPDDYVDAVGLYGAVYSTPHKVFICEELPFNEKTWDWLMREIHLGSSMQEVRWVLQ